MNTKRYVNFTGFYNDFKEEFTRSDNQRLVAWFNLIANLGQGCGCTRASRAAQCNVEYKEVRFILTNQNRQLMQMKFPNTVFEFADGEHLFYTMDV